MTTTEQKIEPFAYQTSTIPEVKEDIKKDGDNKDNNENEENKPNVNRKRSRATPEQLAILEATFEKNTSPNSKLREALAEQVHMSERSIQIWFQNRRAKVKNNQKRHQQAAFQDQLFKSQFYLQYPGGMYGGYPAYGQTIYQPGMPPKIINRSKSIDANMFSQALNPVPEGSIANPIGRLGFGQAQGIALQPPALTPTPTLTPSIEKNYYNFSNKALVIGTWRRIYIPGDNDSLRCCFSIVDKKIRWIIKEQNIRFKVEFPFSSIGQIVLEPYSNNGSTGKLSITLIKLPTFWMETNGPTNSVWNMSGDFTENQQASKVFRHVIEGDYNNLKVEVSSIVRSSIDLQQLCRIVSPTDMLYQQQANHYQRRQSCPAGLLFNPNNQIIGNRRLSIPSNTSLVSIPQSVVVQNVAPTIVQQPMLDTTSQIIQTATAVNPLAKQTTLNNSFVAPQPINQAVVQKMHLASGSTDAVQLQNTAVSIQKPVTVNGISLSPAQNIKTTIPSQTLPIGASPIVPINTITEEVIQPAAALLFQFKPQPILLMS
jgi:Homeodomain-containing transcription factor